PWPLRTREDFARRVVDVPVDRLPTPGMTLGVALLLGAAGPALSFRRTTEFARLDRRYYSPLCLGLAASCAVLALS
ncbi:hypothetical protein, partial [Saccharothrix xinjiangensis]